MLLIDTDICSYAIRRHPVVVQKMQELAQDGWAISAVTAFELHYGIARASQGDRIRTDAAEFLSLVRILPFAADAAEAAAGIDADLKRRGLAIGDKDPLIAGHALSLGASLVTNNLKHFERVSGLQLIRWLDE